MSKEWHKDELKSFESLNGVELIRALHRNYPGKLAVSSSFGAESALLLAMVAEVDPNIPVLTVDTLKLFPETLEYRDKLIQTLGLKDVRVAQPEAAVLAEKDPYSDLRYQDADACCHIRKVLPMAAISQGFRVILDGRKRFQSANRAKNSTLEISEGLIKASPLANFSPEEIEAAFAERNLPKHPLVENGYPSIGCAPCTTPVAPGEDQRSGRWRGEGKTECGLHQTKVNSMSDLDNLEQQSLYILREAFSRIENIALLWSIGKDSCVVLWLVKKAFFGHVPFPIVHVDTGCKMPEMIEFRDKMAKEWNLPLVVGQNTQALKEGVGPHLGRVTCCEALKTQGLKDIVTKHGFKGIIAGIRRDEEGTRAKERVFSPRGGDAAWNFKDQPPEFWDQYNTDVPPGGSIRIHPILHWTEIDIWRYIQRENIPVVDLYFDKGKGTRFRSLGCTPCTNPIESPASSIAEIIAELKTNNTSERAGRAQDKESEDAFEKLRANGYM